MMMMMMMILLEKRFNKIIRKPIDYPSKLILFRIKIFNIDHIYKYTLIKFFHINRKEYLPSSYAYETRNNIKIPLTEHRYFTTAGSKHGIILGPILYNSIIKCYPDVSNIPISIF